VRYFYHHAIGMAPIVAERNETTSQMQRYYVWTPGGRLLYAIDPASGNAVSHYHFDQVGSTLALTAANGSVTDAYAYTPYGVLLGHMGTSSQPFTYVGRYGVRAEPTASLSHMRARYLAPEKATFISRDPVWPHLREVRSLNPYDYAAHTPGTVTDPRGTLNTAISAATQWRINQQRGRADTGFNFGDGPNSQGQLGRFGWMLVGGNDGLAINEGDQPSRYASKFLNDDSKAKYTYIQIVDEAPAGELSAPGPDFGLGGSGPAGTTPDPTSADLNKLVDEWVGLYDGPGAKLAYLLNPFLFEDYLKLGEEIRQMLENHNRGRQGGAGGLGTPSAGSVGFEAGIDDLFGQLGQGR
jgi:RHS repeat-associated protein